MEMAPANGKAGSRKSILELAPLECGCMSALWLLGEGTVRDIREALAPTLPRAYTTIMTIMDRLAHKGAVTRTKKGKAYLYRPNVSAEEARARAVRQLVESYFGGSRQALLAHLGGGVVREASPVHVEARIDESLL
jgi:predicted transcriptional regulator